MSLRTIWVELFDQPWPGDDAAMEAMAQEIRALRLLNDTIVTTALDEQVRQRPIEEIQRAHDLVSQYSIEMDDPSAFDDVSAICWILRHDHNARFAKSLATVEGRMEHLGFQVTRLPELPSQGEE